MTRSWGFVCADGPLMGEVLMLNEPTEDGSLFRVAGLERETHVYRFAGTRFVYVGPGPEPDEPDPVLRPESGTRIEGDPRT